MTTTSIRATPVPPPDLPPLWRHQPYRIFFPLGALLAWAGVLHWLLHAAGWIEDYQSVVHAIVQIQGFMMSFAVGFLLTAIPRRTGTAPPSPLMMLTGLTMPVATTVAAWMQRWMISQIFWLILVAALVAFAVRRFRSRGAARRPPHSFVWIPLSFLIGVIGSVLIAAPTMAGASRFWLHDLGRVVLLQGMFLGLVVGVGGLAIPLITRGEAPPDAGHGPADRAARAANVAAAVLLVATFWIEIRVSQPAGHLLRAALTLALLVGVARIHRAPTVPGSHRKLVWIAAWAIPIGYLVAGVFPLLATAGLHVVFIGGFALMAFAVSLHVTLAHGGRQDLVHGGTWQPPALGALLLIAMILRVITDLDRARFFVWIGAASAAFLLATLVWGWLIATGLRGATPATATAPPPGS